MLPITILAAEHPALSQWMAVIAPFSMFPLLKKDGLTLAYCMVTACSTAATGCLQKSPEHRSHAAQVASSAAALISVGVMTGIHAAAAIAPAPVKYPYIYDAAMVSWAFMHFAAVFLFTNAAHWRLHAKGKTD
jgi:alpha-1,3-glucosyltransferase